MSLAKEETPVFQSSVYPPASLSPSSLAALAVLLQSFLEERCKEELGGYVWQREAPKVVVDTGAGTDEPARLAITMRHGGSVEDEWLAVHLLLLASASPQFSERFLLETLQDGTQSVGEGAGLLIDARDEDGQFILIEAADQLPQWVQPNNADGRFWIYNGHFHLISPDFHPGDVTTPADSQTFDTNDAKPLKVVTAVGLIGNTKVPAEFENTILKQRLPSYPNLSWASLSQHTTLAYLPTKAARVLHQHPQLIANAAEAFDGREGPNDARCLRDMKVFGPRAGQEGNGDSVADVLLTKVKLPRRLYANMLTQRYFPPKRFGDEWRASVSDYWEALEKARRGESSVLGDEESSRGRRRDLGCKITCGLELAFANVKERLKSRQRDMFGSGGESDMRASASYPPFISALTAIGFFGDNIRDSKEWKVKELEAVEKWRELQSGPSERQDEHTSDDLLHLLVSASKDEIGTPVPPHLPSTLPAHALALEEDPDGFLYDAPDQGGNNSGAGGRDGTDDNGDTEAERVAMDQVNAFANKLQGFVDGKGDEAGALFEDEEEEMDSDEGSEEGDGKGSTRRVQDMSQEERTKAMEGLVPGLSAEEWGAQKVREEPASDDMAVDGEIDNGKGVTGEADSKSAATTGFSRNVQYDGASDSEESVDDEVLRAGDTDEDRLNRARWLGMEKELAEDEARRGKEKQEGEMNDWDENGEEGDVQLGQDDLMNFIEFTRKELGLSEEQYADILRERRERGAYVPEKKVQQPFSASRGKKKVNFEEQGGALEAADVDEGEHKSGTRVQAEKREEKAKAMRNQRTSAEEKYAARQRAERVLEEAEAGARGRKGEEGQSDQPVGQGDPFEKLMAAMDDELQRHKSSQTAAGGAYQSSGPMAMDEDDESPDGMDEMSAEEAELLEKMLHNGPPASLRVLMEKQQRGGDSAGLSTVEQEVMESMLASYQAQSGGPGPVSALAGRLGVGRLPRDAD